MRAVRAWLWALEVLEEMIGVRVGSLRWWARFGLEFGFRFEVEEFAILWSILEGQWLESEKESR